MTILKPFMPSRSTAAHSSRVSRFSKKNRDKVRRRKRFRDALRHPLTVTAVGFILTGIIGTVLTTSINNRSHDQDLEMSTRTAALTAVSDISDLTNERRERAALVASAINRGAPASETDARKLAYDEAYIRWNARVPGDLLRVRSALQLTYQPLYEGYIDALTNVDAIRFAGDPDKLLRGQQNTHQSGLFSKMDVCLTNAYDSYRAGGYSSLSKAQEILKSCNFPALYSKSVFCFSTIAESLYRSVNASRNMKTATVSEAEVIDACTPP